MHWCADETQAVINMLSTVDVVWLWVRALVGRVIGVFRPRRAKALPPPCACRHEHGG